MDTGSSSGGVHDDIGEGFPAGGAKPHCEAGGGGGGGGYKMIHQNNYHHYEVGDTVQLRCLGGNLGWEGDDGRYEEVEEAASATSITISGARAEDTGLFTCGRAELGEEVDSVYLWVENPRQLFRNSSPMLFTNVEVKHPKFVKAISVFCISKAGTDMAVGCRASSPRVTVRVERNG